MWALALYYNPHSCLWSMFFPRPVLLMRCLTICLWSMFSLNKSTSYLKKKKKAVKGLKKQIKELIWKIFYRLTFIYGYRDNLYHSDKPENWCFWTVVLEKTLESPLNCKEIQLVHLKEISPGCSLEGLMLKLKLQYFGPLIRGADSFEKTLMLGKIECRRRRGREDEMVEWHHRLDMGLGGLRELMMNREA